MEGGRWGGRGDGREDKRSRGEGCGVVGSTGDGWTCKMEGRERTSGVGVNGIMGVGELEQEGDPGKGEGCWKSGGGEEEWAAQKQDKEGLCAALVPQLPDATRRYHHNCGKLIHALHSPRPDWWLQPSLIRMHFYPPPVIKLCYLEPHDDCIIPT